MAKIHPHFVSPIRELRHALSQMRLNDLSVGKDGRNRTLLSPFRSKTGRNQPSSTEYIFGTSVWLRNLIQPPPGYGIAYIDWAQQEIGIAAALSGDPALIKAYLSGDCYKAFAREAGAISDSTPEAKIKKIRSLYKQCVLGVQYAMGERSLSNRVGQPLIVARDLLRQHRQAYGKFWEWSDAAVSHAMLFNEIHTVFGWRYYLADGEAANPRSLRNWPMQSNGAEMMRLAACLATERGIEVCAPVHDAFLICVPVDRLDHDIAAMRTAMAEASRIVLGGFELRTDYDRWVYPNHFTDEERGTAMWEKVVSLIRRRQEAVA